MKFKLPKFRKSKKLWIITSVGLITLIGFISAAVFLYFFIFADLPSPYTLKDFKAIPISSQIYDRNGKLLYEVFRDENRTPVKLKDLPDYMKESTIAIEDKDFYKHGGISIVSGMLRAVRDTVKTSNLQGGSTITQQLVKSALLTPERTIQRKAKEIILAVWVEQIFSKDEILEMYLNQVPYGGSSYGIAQASKTYFNKKPHDLELHEAAMLAGLPQAPTLYSPHTNPDRAKTRRDSVLRNMFEEGYITEKQMNEAMKKEVNVLPPKTNIKAPHFVFEVKELLEKEYGLKQLEEGGLKVTTTLDLDVQASAEAALREEIDDLQRLNVTNGAVLVTRPPTGEILAMVGSVDYFDGSSGAFNVTTAGTRQPGSSIKPINYAIGIDRGLVTASSMFLDVPTCFSNPGQPKAFCPKNYDNSFHGPVQLRYALANSYNIPAVKMLAYNGVEDFIASSSAFLITSFKDPDNYGLSLTLGGGEVAMTEMAQAFSAFANRGKPRALNYVLKVEDKAGKVLYEFKDPNFEQDVHKPLERPNSLVIKGKNAISEGTAFIISHILQDNGARTSAFGPSSELVIKDRTVSVKTGTTNDLRDNWTIGYTPNFLVAVWVGNNDFTPMAQGVASGLTGASPVWNRVMTGLLEDQPDLPPVKPSSVVGMQVCSDTGVIAGKQGEGYNCPTRFEYLIQGTNSTADISKKQVPVNKDTDQYLPDPNNPAVEMREKTVLKDMFGEYCIDCNHEGEARQTVTVQ
ncbi:penicillin-binding protein [Candidatus Roizmanbacteria bacterium]|nr:MAG: penicillin-binding protein [Candidatus Roizmanbacteria bacterium]